MIVESKDVPSRSHLQQLIDKKAPQKIKFYDPPNQQVLNEIVDYEKKKGTIKAIIILR